MVRHALDRGYEVVGVCRERSAEKLEAFKDRMTIVPGATNDRAVIKEAVEGCDGVLAVLVPWGVRQYSSGTAQAILDCAEPGARRRIFASDRRWTVVRGSDLEEGESQGLPVWSSHVGDPELGLWPRRSEALAQALERQHRASPGAERPTPEPRWEERDGKGAERGDPHEEPYSRSRNQARDE